MCSLEQQWMDADDLKDFIQSTQNREPLILVK